MTAWESLLKNNPTEWLLEKEKSSVRYNTLTGILEKPQNDPEVRETKEQMMKTGVIPRILSIQNPGGYWGNPEDFYIRSKYKGTVWNFIILAELGADGTDKRIKKTCEFLLEHSQDPKSGGFAHYSTKNGGGDHNKVLPCLTGNMVWGLIRFGHLEDPRVQHGIHWITTYQRFDDGVSKAPTGWPYGSYKNCWGTHTCTMGVVKALKALAEIPANKRSTDVKKTIQTGAEYLLKHRLYKRSHNLNQIAKNEWIHFRFPLMWKTDALEMLSILTTLGYKDNRMHDALDLVLSKQDHQGRWTLGKTFNGRMFVTIEQKDQPSKWITLNALRVLKRYYS